MAIIVEKARRDSIGMVIKPKMSMYSSVQETPWEHGCMFSGMMPE
jgi:hypothetical protein